VVAAATTTVLAALVHAPIARGHAEVLTTWPDANQVLTSAPASARVTFGESVEGTPGSCVRIINASGVVLSRTTTCSGQSLTAVPLRPLARGRYVLAYDVTSQDGHRIRSARAFSVGLPTPSASPRTENLRGGAIRLSGGRVGMRTLRVAGSRGVGTISWQHPNLDVPLQWRLRDGRASGMLPFPGTYTVTASVWESAWTSRAINGTVRIRG
jgi:methionine-rich copper-binding protein CopC